MKTTKTPEDIVGKDMKLLIAHFKAVHKNEGTDDFNRRIKANGFSQDERAQVARIYKELRLHGCWPDKISDDGKKIIWGYSPVEGCFDDD